MRAFASGVAYRKGDARHDASVLDDFEHGFVDHLVHDHARLLVGVVARQDLPVGHRRGFRFVGLDLGDGAGFLPPGVVDEVFGVRAEFAVERLARQGGDAGEVMGAHRGQSARYPRADAPYVG